MSSDETLLALGLKASQSRNKGLRAIGIAIITGQSFSTTISRVGMMPAQRKLLDDLICKSEGTNGSTVEDGSNQEFSEPQSTP